MPRQEPDPSQISYADASLPSSQRAPTAANGVVHVPSTHSPATWHCVSGAQVTPWQGSVVVVVALEVGVVVIVVLVVDGVEAGITHPTSLGSAQTGPFLMIPPVQHIEPPPGSPPHPLPPHRPHDAAQQALPRLMPSAHRPREEVVVAEVVCVVVVGGAVEVGSGSGSGSGSPSSTS